MDKSIQILGLPSGNCPRIRTNFLDLMATAVPDAAIPECPSEIVSSRAATESSLDELLMPGIRWLPSPGGIERNPNSAPGNRIALGDAVLDGCVASFCLKNWKWRDDVLRLCKPSTATSFGISIPRDVFAPLHPGTCRFFGMYLATALQAAQLLGRSNRRAPKFRFDRTWRCQPCFITGSQVTDSQQFSDEGSEPTANPLQTRSPAFLLTVKLLNRLPKSIQSDFRHLKSVKS